MKIFNFKLCIEIYITNECNLTCSNCNRYNNYNFQGHYHWQDSAEAINAWSKRITAPIITIIGGEPSLHPELEQWVEGVASAWPDRPVLIQTNGLKPIIAEPWWVNLTKKFPKIGCGIAVHSPKIKDKLKKAWKNKEGHFDAWEFDECALIDRGNSFVTHNSNPIESFSCCGMKHSHTLLHGKLHKCPMVAVLPEFRKQYQVDLLDNQEILLNQYQPLDHGCSDQDLEQFVKDADTAIPQCNLCPESHEKIIVDFDIQRKNRIKKSQ
jgi:hypothetical protein